MRDWNKNILPKKFYDRDPSEVARDLLGKFLVRKIGSTCLVGKITETEGYLPTGDPAGHGFKGLTKRNPSLFKTGGHAYVHSMRQYFLLDVVTESSSKPGSVLLRSIDPIEGLVGIIDGPGKLCRELGITRVLDGIDMTNPHSELYICHNQNQTAHKVIISSRIGISKAKELPLRFQISNQPDMSD